MNNSRMIPRIIAIVTAIVIVIVAILGVQWKSISKAFSASKVKGAEAPIETEVIEIKSPAATETETASYAPAAETSMSETMITEASTAAATTEPAQQTIVAETAADANAATATATTADGTPITVVVQMPEMAMQQPQQVQPQQVQPQQVQPQTLNTEEALRKKALEATWVHYYNLDIQNNGLLDDYNFGPNPIMDGQVREASYYDAELRERLKWDPALAAATTAWVDANVGTRYLGVFYETCEHNWATTINMAKLRFAADQMAYYKNLDALFKFMNAASLVEVRPCQEVTDMMYMNPYTPDGIPEVIVMETVDHSGYELVYHFAIKSDGAGTGGGNDFTVAFRINCGFQPTNVAKLMKIAPQPEPEKTEIKQPQSTPQTESSTPKPTPQTEGSTPKPTPQTERNNSTPTPQTEKNTPTPTPETETPQTDAPIPTPETDTPQTDAPIPTPETETPQTDAPIPTPAPEKDPSEQHAEDADSNDNQGVGESTNNGVGAEYSTADQPENSNHYESYDDYVETVENLEQVNEVQQVGGDSNEPSYTPEVAPGEPVKVDNNGDVGNLDTGSAPIDTPTTVSEPAVAANTDAPITTEPGVAWDGPSD